VRDGLFVMLKGVKLPSKAAAVINDTRTTVSREKVACLTGYRYPFASVPDV